MKKTYIVPTLEIHQLTQERQLLAGSKIDIDHESTGSQSVAESKKHSYDLWEQD